MHNQPSLVVIRALDIVIRILSNIFLFISKSLAAVFSQRKRSSDLIQIDGEIRRRRPSSTAFDYPDDLPENLFELLSVGKRASGNGPCVGYRPKPDAEFVYLSYEELIARSRDFGAGLLKLGARPNANFLVGIFAKTSLEWTVAEYGCLAYGLVTAPLFDSLGYEGCCQLVDFCELEVIVCDGDDHLDVLLGHGQFPKTLRTLITVDRLAKKTLMDIGNHGVKVFTMIQVEEMGRSNPVPVCPSEPDQVATLLFTSGTTGMAKAVMMTHRQFILFLKSFAKSLLPVKLSPADCGLGFLPLPHIGERFIEKLIHLHGGKIGYVGGDIHHSNAVYDDAKEVQPTFFFFVPRLMTRIHNEIQADLSRSVWRSVLAKIGIMFKTMEMQWGIFRNDSLWDGLIFKKYQNILGGRLRVGITGSAPTDGDVLNYIRAVFGFYVFEAYGQTESCGPFTLTSYGDLSGDQVGIPCFDTEIKLVDVPKMKYFAAEGKGEVCARADYLMSGYYKMPDKTAKTIDKDEWLHTGDVGMWLPDGNLRIFDRKKHVFKLSQGEYLAPERLEGAFSRSDLICNIFIDGDSKYPYCVALVYPNDSVNACKDKKAKKKSKEEEGIEKRILDEMHRIGKEMGMKSYEIPKKVYILEEGFSVENGCLTVSNKAKREDIRAKYKQEIVNLYKDNNETDH